MVSKKITILFLFVVLLCLQTYAQRQTFDLSDFSMFPQDESGTTAHINCDEKLKNIEENLTQANLKRQGYGYSVQIFFGSGNDARLQAENARKKFLTKFSDYEAAMVYEPPYFKVRAGNCRTKLEATKLKKLFASEYPGCFIVECKISYPEL